MIRLLATLIMAAALIAVAVLVAMEHRPNGYAMPFLVTGFQQQKSEAIPWVLNTRCGIDSKNLPHRNVEHRV